MLDKTASCSASAPQEALLAGEAGLPYDQTLGAQAAKADPFEEWLSLMEVVQMLCPTWPVRDQAMRGTQWLL
jgi:hypothetical protein